VVIAESDLVELDLESKMRMVSGNYILDQMEEIAIVVIILRRSPTRHNFNK
jgi:hypothetical protein